MLRIPEGLKPTKKKLVLLALLGVVELALLFFGVPRLLHYSSTPQFCAKCHVMAEEYESWFHSGPHRAIRCVDCHLPNDNPANHYLWKSIDGGKDVLYFFSGMVSDHIDATAHAKKTIQANCLRCHSDMTLQMTDKKRKCWECHRAQLHFRNP